MIVNGKLPHRMQQHRVTLVTPRKVSRLKKKKIKGCYSFMIIHHITGYTNHIATYPDGLPLHTNVMSQSTGITASRRKKKNSFKTRPETGIGEYVEQLPHPHLL